MFDWNERSHSRKSSNWIGNCCKKKGTSLKKSFSSNWTLLLPSPSVRPIRHSFSVLPICHLNLPWLFFICSRCPSLLFVASLLIAHVFASAAPAYWSPAKRRAHTHTHKLMCMRIRFTLGCPPSCLLHSSSAMLIVAHTATASLLSVIALKKRHAQGVPCLFFYFFPMLVPSVMLNRLGIDGRYTFVLLSRLIKVNKTCVCCVWGCVCVCVQGPVTAEQTFLRVSVSLFLPLTGPAAFFIQAAWSIWPFCLAINIDQRPSIPSAPTQRPRVHCVCLPFLYHSPTNPQTALSLYEGILAWPQGHHGGRGTLCWTPCSGWLEWNLMCPMSRGPVVDSLS